MPIGTITIYPSPISGRHFIEKIIYNQRKSKNAGRKAARPNNNIENIEGSADSKGERKIFLNFVIFVRVLLGLKKGFGRYNLMSIERARKEGLSR